MPDRDGRTFERGADGERLDRQHDRVFTVMRDGRWRTKPEIAAETRDPAESIGSRLRDFRKDRFGGFQVERRRRGDPRNGVWEYRLIVRRSRTTGVQDI